MNVNIKYCKRCKKAFDIDTSKELCPNCRYKKEGVKEIGGQKKITNK